MFQRKVIVRALICAILALVPFPELENEIYDAKLHFLSELRHEAPKDVVILEISKEDFETLKKNFSPTAPRNPSVRPETWVEKFEALRDQFLWDDHVYLGVLSRLLKENPKHILVTLFYNESLVLLEHNTELQKLARNPKVLWASLFDGEQKLLKPASELASNDNFGTANVFPDNDGVVRRSYLVWNNHISLPFRALIDDYSSLHQHLAITKPFLLHFSGPAKTVQTCRLLDWMQNPNSVCGSLENRDVILAPTANAVATANFYQTPVGTMSRAEIIANTLLTAKMEHPYWIVGTNFLFLVLLLHAFAIAWTIHNFDTIRRISGSLMILVGEAAISLFALRFFRVQIPLVPFISVSLTAYIAFFWLKLARQENKRWQAEKKAQYLRELDELKSNFISLMSHDLKTPIAKVQALTERLDREAQSLSSEHKDILAAIQRSNDELAQYILSILDFQKIESQALELHKKSHDINLLIDEVVLRLEPLAEEKKIQFQKELEPMFSAEFDEKLIRQVLNNLIDNAIKYNHAGTVITVSSADHGSYIQVEVADNGVGMEKNDLQKLFRKFSRSKKSTAERVKGTGLGLYLARYFIELHGGKISVESEPGKGTSFRFTLPV